jgi:uncharacterized protein (TIGR00290 family)
MDILFWSGGKDSYLALEFYQREFHNRSLALLTTYREDTNRVPHQDIPISDIKTQAEQLGFKLYLVPLPAEASNEVYLDAIKNKLKKVEVKNEEVEHLVFGDWKLKDIREWREEQFSRMGHQCLFPIWKKSLHDLLAVLILKPVEVTISSVQQKWNDSIHVGEAYNQRFVQQLPPEIDPMGEHGEFHTKVTIQSFDDIDLPEQSLY